MELHLSASKAFATLDALRLVPPPNRTPEDLNAHIRAVLFGSAAKARAA